MAERGDPSRAAAVPSPIFRRLGASRNSMPGPMGVVTAGRVGWRSLWAGPAAWSQASSLLASPGVGIVHSL